jgi:hypothetical protein
MFGDAFNTINLFAVLYPNFVASREEFGAPLVAAWPRYASALLPSGFNRI